MQLSTTNSCLPAYTVKCNMLRLLGETLRGTFRHSLGTNSVPLKMEAASSSKVTVRTHYTMCSNYPERYHLCNFHCEDLKIFNEPCDRPIPSPSAAERS
jgi:hypothetical protein